jgi:hypothetical protein
MVASSSAEISPLANRSSAMRMAEDGRVGPAGDAPGTAFGKTIHSTP